MYFNLRLFAMTEGMRLPILLAALGGLLAVVTGIARLAVSGVVIARVFQGEAFSTLVLPLAALATLIILRSLFQLLRDAVSHRTANAVKINLRGRLYEHAIALGPSYFDQRRTGAALMFLVDGVENLETFFGQYLPQLLVAALAPILIFAFMALLDVQIGLIFLGFAVFMLIIPSLIQRWNRRRNLARQDAYGALGADFLDSIQGLATLKAFGQSKRRGELLANRARDLFRTTMAVLATDGASGAATIFGISAGAMVALAWGSMRVSAGELELSSLLIVLMLGGEIFRPLRELTQLYHQGMTAMSSAEGIFGLLDSPVTISGPAAVPSQLQHPGVNEDPSTRTRRLAPQITFEDVHFGYQGGRRPAIQDVSFTLHPGDTLALVGPSGAGKSTVVWLMLRFHDPQRGRVLLGGHDLRELPLDVIREQIAVVTQDTYLFQGSVAENLLLGRPDATQDELETAARAANAHDFIVKLPGGYDTHIGERGIRLSAGERQRIAIARALLKAAPILVLDEALSSVDAENEAAIQEALARLMVGRTTLIIAHRLSSVVNADRILVLDKGRVMESGSHAELADSGGFYARLMANQHAKPEQDLIAATLSPAQRDGTFDNLEPRAPSPIRDEGHHGTLPRSPARPLGAMDTWARLLRLARPWRAKLILSLAFGVTFHGATIALAAISALLVAEVFKGGETSLLLALLAVVIPLAALSKWGESWLSHDVAFRLLAVLRIGLYSRLDPLAPAYMVRRSSGDLTSIVGGDVEKIENFYAHVITPALVAMLVPGGVLIVLALIAWPLALVLLPFLLLAAASPFFAQKQSERLGMEMRRQLGDLNAHMVDGIQGMREIVAFGRGNARVDETVKKGQTFGGHRIHFLQIQASHASFIEAVMALGGLVVLTTGVWLVVQNQMPQTHLPLATLLALSSFLPITELARTLKELMETLAASHRIFEVHDQPVTIQDGSGVSIGNGRGLLKRPTITLQQVSFSYGHGRPPALQDVTFTIEAGQTVALVGRSGAGKTTAAHILMRYWDPDVGTVLLGGHDLRSFKLDVLRSHIALVSQDTYLFNTSIRENLRIARQDGQDPEIEEAARLANASEFIEAMPDGYETLVGERGMQLSGGQRQRIAIARALLKDAPVLLLDEATSHLDAINEQQVREALHRLMERRTTLVIAHRLSTVRDADRIVVMDSGRVEEHGTHRELLSRGGLYSQLVHTQLVSASAQSSNSSAD